MEAIPDGLVPRSPSALILDWLPIRCFSSAFSASSWSMSACRASIVSSNSLRRTTRHGCSRGARRRDFPSEPPRLGLVQPGLDLLHALLHAETFGVGDFSSKSRRSQLHGRRVLTDERAQRQNLSLDTLEGIS
ncbi:hypothetical protein EYF80_038870 [Liparis tanakae]|uniref:Uncharacterized protein n=1 Tax=Liparis tanakae TaxID=230148 RepID=A0A4Z2GBE4_9TELE|nr:hypothetical protein EYF80_038870 [Liparis tanakae]